MGLPFLAKMLLSDNCNITSAVHNCLCALHFARGHNAHTICTAVMLTLLCKLHKTKNFGRIFLKDSWITERAAKILQKSDPHIYATENSHTI